MNNSEKKKHLEDPKDPSRTTNLNIQSETYNGPVQVKTSIQIENLWQELKTAIHIHSLELFCKEDWAVMQVCGCIKLADTKPRSAAEEGVLTPES